MQLKQKQAQAGQARLSPTSFLHIYTSAPPRKGGSVRGEEPTTLYYGWLGREYIFIAPRPIPGGSGSACSACPKP
jgi:hypothetical protein